MAIAREHLKANMLLRSLSINLDEMVAVMAATGLGALLERRPEAEFPSLITVYQYEYIARAFGLKNDPSYVDDPDFLELWQQVRSAGAICPHTPSCHRSCRLTVSVCQIPLTG